MFIINLKKKMNQYVALALLGTVSACHWSEKSHHKSHHHAPLFGMLEPAAHCPKTDVPRLSHHDADRLFLKNMYQGLVKGWYQENHDVISDECFGDWMEPTFKTIHDMKKKMHEDFWSVSLSEVKSTGALFLDTIYKNMDVCHFERVGDDAKGWCIENPAQCIFLENLEERLFDSMFEILGSAFDLFKLYTKDDSCYTDMEKMAEIYRFNADVGELMAVVSGFDYKWDQSIERKHIKKNAFHKQIRLAIKDLEEQYKNMDPMFLMFPDLQPIFEQLHALMKKFKKAMTPPKIDYKHMKKPVHHSLTNMWGMPTQHQKLPTHTKKDQIKVPTHHQQMRDPFADMFKTMFKPQHHQQYQQPTSQWGQMKMPNWNTHQQFGQMQKFDFSNFKLF